MTWKKFLKTTPPRSIGLDGVVRGIPNYDPETNHVSFDHHEGVVTREAMMSTARQTYFAIKGGLMDVLKVNGEVDSCIYINHPDYDTVLAIWYLMHYEQFEGTNDIPAMGRLLELCDRWDITGGAFPTILDNKLVREHTWVFKPYADLRKSGRLAQATAEVLTNNLIEVLERIDLFASGQAEEAPLDTCYGVLYEGPGYKIVDEVGGHEARYRLFNKGMHAFISLVSRLPSGRCVYAVGRRSRFIRFPVEQLYDAYNALEGLDRSNGWSGSDIIGGSPLANGSGLSWEQLRDATDLQLQQPLKARILV